VPQKYRYGLATWQSTVASLLGTAGMEGKETARPFTAALTEVGASHAGSDVQARAGSSHAGSVV